MGKHTLVEAIDVAPAAAVQQRATAGATTGEPAAAAHGVSGAAGALPHLDRVQQLHDEHARTVNQARGHEEDRRVANEDRPRRTSPTGCGARP
ncbi:MAG: hypothetical protein ABIY55_27210 [Kofleriaceae bacterium]